MSGEKNLFEQGLGNVTWWGFSPAKNVVDELGLSASAGSKGKNSNFILKYIPFPQINHE